MEKLLINKISANDKMDVVCQWTGNNCSTKEKPSDFYDPCGDDCNPALGKGSAYKSTQY